MRYPGTPQRQIMIGVLTLFVLAVAIAAGVVMDTSSRSTFQSGITSMEYDGFVASSSTGAAPMMNYAMDEARFTLSSGKTAVEVDQKIIKTGYLTITVDGVTENVQAISSVATAAGGFVQSSSVSEDSEGNRLGYIIIRIPAKAFESTMQSVKDLAVHIETESSDGQDVTEQYTDLEARLNAAQAQEAQYLLILEDAATVGEVLAVQEHLALVRSDIESLEGQIQYLTNQTEYSTLSVSITEETKVSLPSAKFNLVRDVKEAAKFVVTLGQRALSALIWVVIVGGAVSLPLAVIAWIGWLIAKHARQT